MVRRLQIDVPVAADDLDRASWRPSSPRYVARRRRLTSTRPQSKRFNSTRNPLAALTRTSIRSLIRLVASTPFGDVFVVPLAPLSQRAIARLPAGLRARVPFTAGRGNVLMFATVGPGGAGCCSDAAGLASSGVRLLSQNRGSQNRGSPTLVTLVLPDGSRR